MNGIAFYREMNPHQVKDLVKVHVRSFKEEPDHALDAKLEICEPVNPTPEMIQKANHKRWIPTCKARWHVKVVEPYCD